MYFICVQKACAVVEILAKNNVMFIQMDFKCGSDSMIQSEQSPGSPDRQFCSSTTSAIGDFGNDSVIQDTVKEELPR
jgi:hypothetical protein